MQVTEGELIANCDLLRDLVVLARDNYDA